MDEKAINIEKLAPELLLKRGVKVPVTAPLFLRLFGKKTVNLYLRQPTSRTLLKIAHQYLKMNITKSDEDISVNDAMKLYSEHGKTAHQIVSTGLLNSRWFNWLNKPLSYWLEGKLTEPHWLYLYQMIIVHGGVEDFLNTIRLIRTTRITKPMNLSPKEKAS